MLTDEQKKVASRAFDDVDDMGTGCVPNTSAVLMELVQLTGLNPTQREIDNHWNKEWPLRKVRTCRMATECACQDPVINCPKSPDISDCIMSFGRNSYLGDVITKEQFLELVTQFEWKEPEEMRLQLEADFEIFDTEGTGIMEAEDLVHILSQEGRNAINREDAEEIVNSFEKDANGQINIAKLIDTLLAPRILIETKL